MLWSRFEVYQLEIHHLKFSSYRHAFWNHWVKQRGPGNQLYSLQRNVLNKSVYINQQVSSYKGTVNPNISVGRNMGFPAEGWGRSVASLVHLYFALELEWVSFSSLLFKLFFCSHLHVQLKLGIWKCMGCRLNYMLSLLLLKMNCLKG